MRMNGIRVWARAAGLRAERFQADTRASITAAAPYQRAQRRTGAWRRLALFAAIGPILVMTPSGAAASPMPIAKGDLVVSLLSDEVDEFTPSGQFVQHLMTSANGLGLPTGAAFDGSGNLYVTDFANNQVLKRDALTGAVSVFANSASLGSGHTFDAPESIVFDKGYAHAYISDANRDGPGGGINVVNTLTGEGTAFYPLTSSLGSEGAGESDWLAFDASATLFMTNENPAQGVMKVDAGTGDIVQPSVVANLPNVAYAMSFDKNGNLWVGDTDRILEFTKSGAPINVITNSSFSSVFAAVFNPEGDHFYAGDLNTGIVYTYALDGSPVGSFNAGAGVSGLAVAGALVPPNSEPPAAPAPTWAGYVLPHPSGAPVSTRVTIPNVSCNTAGDVSMWVGYDGYEPDSNTVEQDGVTAECGSAGGAPKFRLWYELFKAKSLNPFPNVNEVPIPSKVNLTAGDSVDLFVDKIEPDRFHGIPLGQDKVFFAISAYDGAGRPLMAQWTKTVTEPLAFSPRYDSSECILERPTTSRGPTLLPDFGTAAFTNCSVIDDATSPNDLIRLNMTAHGHTLASTSGIGRNTNGENHFSIEWKASG